MLANMESFQRDSHIWMAYLQTVNCMINIYAYMPESAVMRSVNGILKTSFYACMYAYTRGVYDA